MADHDPESLSRAATSSVDYGATTSLGNKAHHTALFHEFDDDSAVYGMVGDPMTYSLRWLKTWWAFVAFHGTIWKSIALWRTMAQLMCLSLVVGLISYNTMPDPELLDTSKFGNITAVFSVFVSLMLSFYLSSSVQRWLACVTGFLNLFNSIRNLALQMHALGVAREEADRVLRYGLLSSFCLVHELRSIGLSEENKKEQESKLWAYLVQSEEPYSRLHPDELEVLRNIDDRSSQLWVWVCSFLGRMAMDGHIPNMASPTYGRIMNLAQEAQVGLRQVRISVVVQMPFVYVHTLSVLVHINSILLAICMGLSVGVVYHGMRNYMHHYYYEKNPDPNLEVEPMTSLIQSLLIEILKGVFGPLLYQAFLEIGIHVSSPFNGSESAIPVNRLMHELERDLTQANRLADATARVGWEKPKFKT